MHPRESEWDSFDSDAYFARNYRELRDDDREIIQLVRDFFAGAAVRDGRGVDVGAGPNLYPALAMLPFCAHLDLVDISRSNVHWLADQTRRTGRARFLERWTHAWSIFRENAAYAELADPHRRLTAVTRVRRDDVFGLPRAQWDLGTMFFVACSISREPADFREAVRHFLSALVPHAPFATAFMANSHGYTVSGHEFPGVPLDVATVRQTLEPLTYDLEVKRIDSQQPLRPEVGMILAVGRTATR